MIPYLHKLEKERQRMEKLDVAHDQARATQEAAEAARDQATAAEEQTSVLEQTASLYKVIAMLTFALAVGTFLTIINNNLQWNEVGKAQVHWIAWFGLLITVVFFAYWGTIKPWLAKRRHAKFMKEWEEERKEEKEKFEAKLSKVMEDENLD